ncbi:MAG: hypothetical protein BZY88_08420 [SAR202 cluster bacterium Io17-Chloro-G9]|nr:MAG: hypothetical protein BZY88_08420 [SAR202 cluster bacterium Io17-Chloro-G9]
MTSQAQEHTLTSREFFTKAEAALAQGDLLQASEKLWGATAHMVKAAAERRGWEHSGHRELFQVVNRLANESGDLEFRHLFHTANSLHSNFYENWMSEDWIEAGAQQVMQLLEKLENLP